MKLPIKKKWFDKIKKGEKTREFREAHITFICEETGEKLRKKVIGVGLFDRKNLHESIKSLFKEKTLIVFDLKATADNSDFKTASPKLKHS